MAKRRLTHRERKANRIGIILFTSILLAIILMVLSLPQFYVSSIEITGRRVITQDKIAGLVNIKERNHLFQGVNGNLKEIFQLRHTTAEKILLKNLPYIKNVEIRSIFPSILSIKLIERVEVAYIAISDGCVIIDADGVVLEVLKESGTLGIPVIEGIMAYQIQSGNKVTVDLPDALNNAIVLLNDIINADKQTNVDVKLLPRIKTIRPIQNEMLFLTIKLPDTEEEFIVKVKNAEDTFDKMIWLRFALEQGKLEGKGKGILDITSAQKVFIPE